MPTKKLRSIFIAIAVIALVATGLLTLKYRTEEASAWGKPVNMADYATYMKWTEKNRSDTLYKHLTPLDSHYQVALKKLQQYYQETSDSLKKTHSLPVGSDEVNVYGHALMQRYWKYLADNPGLGGDILIVLYEMDGLDGFDKSVTSRITEYATSAPVRDALMPLLNHKWHDYFKGAPMRFIFETSFISGLVTRSESDITEYGYQHESDWVERKERPILYIQPVLVKTNKKMVLRKPEYERMGLLDEEGVVVEYFDVKISFYFYVPGQEESWLFDIYETNPKMKIGINYSGERPDYSDFMERAYRKIFRQAFERMPDNLEVVYGFKSKNPSEAPRLRDVE